MNRLYESAPSINNSEDYWLNKGKVGKKCMIYFHDDLDGIMSGIVIRQYLQNKGFEIVGYGVVNYQSSWNNIELDLDYINIAVDFAEDNVDLDIYIDHHGKFIEDGGNIEQKGIRSVKTPTGSAYEGICIQLGVSTDSLILDVIDMVDSAKYEFYDVDIRSILNFNLQDILNSDNPTMVFAGAFNQLIKRGDYKTLIEVTHNATLSIKNIYLKFKLLYPLNNINKRSGHSKEFVEDGRDRVSKMIKRVKGKGSKKVYNSQEDFQSDHWNGEKIKGDGYQIIGKLAFIPTGTWANALRGRAILIDELKEIPEILNHDVYFILLQYGGSLQIADTIGMKNIPHEELPVLRDGTIVKNLGYYTDDLLSSFKSNYHYNKSITKSGGHTGIGNISNVVGVDKHSDIKWVDLFKNKIINDLSGVEWETEMKWDIYKESVKREVKINDKILMINEIRNL